MRRHPSHERGRPPHPDVLTPAEWQVLEHVRRGRSNAEIADHLDVSVNTVRTHVSSMLAKLELPDRTALARWDGEPAAASLEAIARRGSAPAAGLLAWLRGASRVLGSSARVVAAVGAAVLVAAVVIAAAAMSREDPRPPSGADTPPPPTATPEVATPPVTPAATSAVPTRPIVVGAPYRPTNLSMIVASDEVSTRSDRMPDRIDRVNFDASGAVRTETLLAASELGWGQFWTIAASRDGSTIVVASCTRGDCALMGNDPSADAQTTLVRTVDGGKTWREWVVLDGAFQVSAFLDDELLVIQFRGLDSSTSEAKYDLEFNTLDSGGRLKGRVAPPNSSWVPSLSGPEPIWNSGDRTKFVRDDGSVVVTLGIDRWYDAGALEIFPVGGGWGAIVFGDPCEEPGRDAYACVARFDAAGQPVQVFTRATVFGVHSEANNVFAVSSVGTGEVRPILLDLVAGEVGPIAEFLSPEWLTRDRMELLAVTRGS